MAASLFASNAGAVDLLVTTDADSGAGSLRDAISTAASGDRIVFDIAGTPTIQLLSDLPDLANDISFANNNATPVLIDRNGFGPLNFTGSIADPSSLSINTGGVASADTDISASSGTTLFGAGSVSGNIAASGTLAPGASADAGVIGTFEVTGNLDLSGARVEADLSATGGTPTSDLVDVTGTATITGATLSPSFDSSNFAAGQQFLILRSTNPLVGTFTNQSDVFALANNPFLQAVMDTSLSTSEFGLLIQDSGVSFADVVSGQNQTSAAGVLDALQASASPPASVVALRNGSNEQVQLAVNQLSGSIYPSLLVAEINHVQSNVESVRDRVAIHTNTTPCYPVLMPWLRAYGVTGEVDADDFETVGYRHRVGGAEIGVGIISQHGFRASVFGHIASADFDTRGVDQHADIDSYRIGGTLEYVGYHAYALGIGGAGTQSYDVRRSLSEYSGSTFAESSFDGSSSFGYAESGLLIPVFNSLWSPYVAMHSISATLDPFAEIGDDDLALSGSGGSSDSVRSVLGLSISQSAISPLGIATTRLRFGWIHEYLEQSETFITQVAGGGTPVGPLEDQGVQAGNDWGFVRVQVDMGWLLGGQLMAAYQGQANSDSSISTLSGGTRWVF